MKIAIMGATSHIAKGLTERFLRRREDHLYLFARSADKITELASNNAAFNGANYTICSNYSDFHSYAYDVIVNCIGVGTLNKHRGDYTLYFTVPEAFDNMAIDYINGRSRNTLYISMGSGAVYGNDHSAPVDENSVNRVKVNRITAQDYYSISRLNAEAKHRAFSRLNIIDLRVFSYFSRFINLADGYFITEVLNSIQSGKTLVTDPINMVRDYLHPDDLFLMIIKCLNAGNINCAFDVSSSKPVEKREILEYFSTVYGLKYTIGEPLDTFSATGQKSCYCSTYNAAAGIGYIPVYSSMDTIKQESKAILDEFESVRPERQNRRVRSA